MENILQIARFYVFKWNYFCGFEDGLFQSILLPQKSTFIFTASKSKSLKYCVKKQQGTVLLLKIHFKIRHLEQ